MGEFITVGAITLNLAHIVSVEVGETGRVYIEMTTTTNYTPRIMFDDEEADALRFHFRRVSTDIGDLAAARAYGKLLCS
jgi:hypothetical protein